MQVIMRYSKFRSGCILTHLLFVCLRQLKPEHRHFCSFFYIYILTYLKHDGPIYTFSQSIHSHNFTSVSLYDYIYHIRICSGFSFIIVHEERLVAYYFPIEIFHVWLLPSSYFVVWLKSWSLVLLVITRNPSKEFISNFWTTSKRSKIFPPSIPVSSYPSLKPIRFEDR